MNQTPARFAYRCLPLVIANSHGWELLVDQPFVATWSGGSAASELEVSFPEEPSPLAASHFGEGVLTFQVGYLFETEDLYNLWIMGPINEPKDGIMPLCGVVETDWIPYTFTMNWLFTRPGTVRFERGEPFCHFFPIPRRLLSAVSPEIRDLEEVPDKSRIYTSWRTSRAESIDRLYEGQVRPTDQGWDKHYYQGQTPNGEMAAKDHETRLMVRPFADHTALQIATSQEGSGPRKVPAPARTGRLAPVEPKHLPAERMVRAHFMGSGSEDLTVAFPDPLFSASIHCRDGLDEVVQRAVAPFRLRLGQSPGGEQHYLWFLRNGQHLDIHVHGPEERGPEMRRWLEEAVKAFFTERANSPSEVENEAQDGTLVWTGYRRSEASLGGGQFLLDHRYSSLITTCLARGCDLVLASLNRDGGITNGSRRTTLLHALVAGLSVLGWPLEKRFSYLTYHRDSVLRETLAPGQGGVDLRKAISFLDTRAQTFTEAIQRLREMVSEEWTGSTDPPSEPTELGSWQRSLRDVHAYTGRFFGDSASHLDRGAAEPTFVSLFKAFHGIANPAGMTRADEAFWCHLLVRAGLET